MSISVVESTSNGIDISDVTLTLSSAPSDGDLMVAQILSNPTINVSPPAGWTEVAGSPFGTLTSPNPRMGVFWKIASSEGTTFQFTRDFASGDTAGTMLVAHSTTGWKTSPEDRSVGYADGGDHSSLGTPFSGTTSQADELAVYMAGMSNWNIGSAITWDNGTADESFYGNSTVYMSLGLAHQTLTAVGSYKSTATWTNAVRVVTAVATFMPSAGGTPLTLTPNGDGTRSVVINESGGTTNLYASVDDSPDTPTTSDWITAGENDGYAFLDMTSTPGDFGSMQTPLTVRAYLTSVGFGTDTCTVYGQVFKSDETTALTTEGTVGTQVSSGLVTGDLTVNAAGLAASKADWDAARLKVRWNYTP